MFEENTNKKKLSLIKKTCPMCRLTFVYSCTECVFFNEKVTRTFLRQLNIKTLSIHEFNLGSTCVTSPQHGHILLELRTKESLSSNSEARTTSTLPVTAQNQSSTSSVKLRKSSNIFTSLVKKARRKKSPKKSDNEELKNVHVSSQNMSCTSTLSLEVHAEEVELSCQNYEKKCDQKEMVWKQREDWSEVTSNHSQGSFTKNPQNLLTLSLAKDDTAQTDCNSNLIQSEPRSHTDSAIKFAEEDTVAISSFLPFKKHSLNVDLTDGLQYLQEVVNNLHDSEKHIVDLLTRYIRDPGVQSELASAISQHTKLQWDTERRSCSLANDMWMQQLEISRAQEMVLQNTLNALVKQNRQLQVDTESLFRKHEKAVRMLRGHAQHKQSYQEHDPQVDFLLRHNEKLQVKLETVFKKCESIEGELQMFQTQNENMEQQLRSSTVKMQNMKALVFKMRTEYEIERAALNFKLENKEQMLKEALEAGDVLLEDLDRIKRQLKNTPFGLNWTKFKIRGSCLTDLIHMARSCLNELSKEVVNMHTDLILKDKDILTLRDTNTRLQENLKKSTDELDTVAKKLKENFAVANDALAYEQKCRMLEDALKLSEEKIEKLTCRQEGADSLRVKNVADFEIYKQQLEEKERILEQTKLFLANVTSENYVLKNDMTVLNRLIEETGAGDVVREIENNQREIEYIQVELKKLEAEKHNLATELAAARHENSILLVNHETAHKHLNRQIEELQSANEEAQTFRRKFDAEHQTVLSLQQERKRYLEEKNLLKSIVQHLRTELARIRQLEEHVTKVSQEANKLGLAAEYNKKQGEQLKKEVIERDIVIEQLKTSVTQLNDIQMQNAREKLSLCHELNEVCQLKEKLSEILNTEIKKNTELGQAKETIVKSVHSQIQKMEERQKNERTAIKILLKDVKVLAENKEALLKEKDKLLLEIEQLAFKHSEGERKSQELGKEIEKRDQQIAELRRERDHYEKIKRGMNESLESERSKYDLNVKQLKKLIEQLRSDKKDLQESVTYLKNNTEKLHKDLNASRQNEKEINDMFDKTKRQYEEQQKIATEQKKQLENLAIEKKKLDEEKLKLIDNREKMATEIGYLNTVMDSIVADFEKSIKSSEEKEQIIKAELEESKSLIQKYSQEIEVLKKAIHLKEERIIELKDLAKGDQMYQKRYIELKEEMDILEKDHHSLKENKMKLENLISDLQEDRDRSVEHLKNVEKECEVLENQLRIVLDQKEEDYVFYKKHIAELMRNKEDLEQQSQKQLTTLKQQLQEINNKMANEKAAYETLSQVHKEISAKFMKSIKDLVDVKNSKQELLEHLKESQVEIEDSENEKNELNKQLSQLSEELKKSKDIENQLNEENHLLEKSYNKALDKCVALEQQIKAMECVQKQEIVQVDDRHEEKDNLQKEIEMSKKELEETSETMHRLKTENSKLAQEITILQIERSDVTVQLHETRKKLETEKSLSEQLKNTHKLLLAAVLQLRDEGKVDPADCIHLLHMVRSSNSLPADGDNMEFLSSTQLQGYNSVIDQIQSELEKSKNLKQEIEKKDNIMIIHNLSKAIVSYKVALVNVKIFSDLVNLLHLYGDEIKSDVSNLLKRENCKFYLVEIYITDTLFKKLLGLNCFLMISVKYGCTTLCKTFPIKDCAMPLFKIIAVDEKIIDSVVSVNVFMLDDSFLNLTLDTVLVDISHHFETNKKSKSLSKDRKLLEISKLYNTSFDYAEIRKPLFAEYQFLTNIDSKELVKICIQNCYHQMDLECFSELGSETKSQFVLKFSSGLDKHSITYDRASNVITLKSDIEKLVNLKKYFCKNSCVGIGNGDKIKKHIEELLLSVGKWESKDDLCSLYFQLRRFWTNSYL